MLGSMNRIFPGGRYYSPLVGGPLKYLAVLLVRLFMITGSVLLPGVFILNAVANYTDTSPDIFADVTVITVGTIVIGLWSLTIARDLLTRNRFGTSEPAQPGLWQLILNDLLLRGAHHGPQSVPLGGIVVSLYNSIGVGGVVGDCRRFPPPRSSQHCPRCWVHGDAVVLFGVYTTPTSALTLKQRG